jgi:integrase
VLDYQPTVDDPIWHEVRGFVTRCVEKCSGQSPYADRELSIAATKLSVWGWETAGFELDETLMFRRDVIANFIATGASEYKPAGRGNLRTQLLRMSEILLPNTVQRRLPPLLPSEPTRPYRPKEVQSLRAWAAAQTTSNRRANAATLLSLGLGAGLTAAQIGNLRVRDITADPEGVVVHLHGEWDRHIPVLREWEDDLVARTRQLGPDRWAFRENHTVFYPNLISNFVNRSQVTVVRPQTQRMRTTWLLAHLAAGTPVSLLLSAAGIESLSALTRYLRFLEPVDATTARRLLRAPMRYGRLP